MSILAECPICRRKQSIRNKLCQCGIDLDRAKRSKKVRYWIDYRLPGGKQRREPVGYSIEEARDADGKRRGQKRENRIFDILPIADMTFNQLAKWFLEIEHSRMEAGEISPAYLYVKTLNIKSFNSFFGDSTVRNLTPEDLTKYKASRKRAGKSDSYVDHEIGAVRSMINTAFINRKVSGETLRVFKTCKKLLKRGSNARKKVITCGEYISLYESSALHLKPIVAAAFWTGMRRGEILNLTWDKVDIANRMIRLEASDTKEGYMKRIPIAKPLRDILLQIPGRGKHGHVFTFRGKPISDIRESMIKACSSAGITYGRKENNGFVFHDLRHTAKTNARKAGVDRNLRMVMFGHSDGNDMEFRYDTIDDADLLYCVDQIESFLGIVDKNVDQERNKKPAEAG
jgi:integrase